MLVGSGGDGKGFPPLRFRHEVIEPDAAPPVSMVATAGKVSGAGVEVSIAYDAEHSSLVRGNSAAQSYPWPKLTAWVENGSRRKTSGYPRLVGANDRTGRAVDVWFFPLK